MDPCGLLMADFTGISMVADGVLELGTESFNLEVNMTTLSPAGSISGNLLSETINITGMYALAMYTQKHNFVARQQSSYLIPGLAFVEQLRCSLTKETTR